MYIRKLQRVKYPKLFYYVKDKLPKVGSVDAVQRAFLEYAQMDRASVKKALRWGPYPVLVVGGIQDAFLGKFDPKKPHEIRIHHKMADDFETGPSPRYMTHNASGQKFPRIGAVILHELVHWGDHKDGIRTSEGLDDAGDLFEKAVYGRDV